MVVASGSFPQALGVGDVVSPPASNSASPSRLPGEECGDVAGEVAVAGLLEGAVVVDVDVRALLGYPETVPDLLRFVFDVGDRSGPRVRDEFRKVLCACKAGHPDDRDLVAELLLYLCDRRGFCTSKRSPGCPEP